MAGKAVANSTNRQRSVLPSGPPLRRGAPAAAPASDAKVGSVAASAATSTMITGQDNQCRPGPRCRAAHTANPVKVSRSEARSPISLTTNPHGRLTPRARATAPSRLAPASRSARNSAARGHQPSATATPAAPAASTPATVNTSGEIRRATAICTIGVNRRVYQGLSAYRPSHLRGAGALLDGVGNGTGPVTTLSRGSVVVSDVASARDPDA